ncbi:MAG: hypothetical protein IH607_04505, partial [Firmicutes bacterium]|nr:hypothetical protein [Bacillota bacterium]
LQGIASDDVTLLLQPFGFAEYAELSPYFDKRRRHIHQAYILPADQATADTRLKLKTLWELYQRESPA